MLILDGDFPLITSTCYIFDAIENISGDNN